MNSDKVSHQDPETAMAGASITTTGLFTERRCKAATPGTKMSRPGLPLVMLAAFLAVAVPSLGSARHEPKEVSRLLFAPATCSHISQHATELP
jgi:hypothetical protein